MRLITFIIEYFKDFRKPAILGCQIISTLSTCIGAYKVSCFINVFDESKWVQILFSVFVTIILTFINYHIVIQVFKNQDDTIATYFVIAGIITISSSTVLSVIGYNEGYSIYKSNIAIYPLSYEKINKELSHQLFDKVSTLKSEVMKVLEFEFDKLPKYQNRKDSLKVILVNNEDVQRNIDRLNKELQRQYTKLEFLNNETESDIIRKKIVKTNSDIAKIENIIDETKSLLQLYKQKEHTSYVDYIDNANIKIGKIESYLKTLNSDILKLRNMKDLLSVDPIVINNVISSVNALREYTTKYFMFDVPRINDLITKKQRYLYFRSRETLSISDMLKGDFNILAWIFAILGDIIPVLLAFTELESGVIKSKIKEAKDEFVEVIDIFKCYSMLPNLTRGIIGFFGNASIPDRAIRVLKKFYVIDKHKDEVNEKIAIWIIVTIYIIIVGYSVYYLGGDLFDMINEKIKSKI